MASHNQTTTPNNDIPTSGALTEYLMIFVNEYALKSAVIHELMNQKHPALSSNVIKINPTLFFNDIFSYL